MIIALVRSDVFDILSSSAIPVGSSKHYKAAEHARWMAVPVCLVLAAESYSSGPCQVNVRHLENDIRIVVDYYLRITR